MSLLAASLYLLCLAFLFGSAVFVYSRDPYARLNASYALLAFALLAWVGTLFAFSAQSEGSALLWLGRANFAAAALAAPACLAFVQALRKEPFPLGGWLWAETLAVAGLSLATGLIDRSEAVRAGIHVTAYGPLFPLYVAHAVAFLLAAIWQSFRRDRSLPGLARQQLDWVGTGIVATALVSVAANAVLPYVWGDFRFIHVGTLSTIFFLGAVAYAAVFRHLFDIRVVVRATLVFALLVGFALELYQAAVEALAKLLPLGDPSERHVAAAAVALTINAFTHEPLRRWLERLADRLLAGRQGSHTRHRSRQEAA